MSALPDVGLVVVKVRFEAYIAIYKLGGCWLAVQEKWFAVVTGDIVGSSRLAERRERALFRLKNALESTKVFLQDTGHYAAVSGVFRGDSFQFVTGNTRHVLRAVLILKALLLTEVARPLRIRVAVGLGPVEELDWSSVEESHGLAFEIAGKALDNLPGYRHLLVVSAQEGPNPCLATLSSCLDAISQKWTQVQGEALVSWLRGETQASVASALGVTQSAIQQRLSAACGFAVADALQYYESVVFEDYKPQGFFSQ